MSARIRSPLRDFAYAPSRLRRYVVVEVFSKKTQTTPNQIIATCRRRLQRYDELVADEKEENEA